MPLEFVIARYSCNTLLACCHLKNQKAWLGHDELLGNPTAGLSLLLLQCPLSENLPMIGC